MSMVMTVCPAKVAEPIDVSLGVYSGVPKVGV